jgi:hypothetical protein
MSDKDTMPGDAAPAHSEGETVRLILSWLFVGAPTIWGMFKVAQEAAKLFR